MYGYTSSTWRYVLVAASRKLTRTPLAGAVAVVVPAHEQGLAPTRAGVGAGGDTLRNPLEGSADRRRSRLGSKQYQRLPAGMSVKAVLLHSPFGVAGRLAFDNSVSTSLRGSCPPSCATRAGRSVAPGRELEVAQPRGLRLGGRGGGECEHRRRTAGL